jgi:hypothetical protein
MDVLSDMCFNQKRQPRDHDLNQTPEHRLDMMSLEFTKQIYT